MFHSPELPGVDAVYLNRIKAGEFTELEESEEEEEEVPERKKPRHPFINYECEETEEDLEWQEDEGGDGESHNELIEVWPRVECKDWQQYEEVTGDDEPSPEVTDEVGKADVHQTDVGQNQYDEHLSGGQDDEDDADEESPVHGVHTTDQQLCHLPWTQK